MDNWISVKDRLPKDGEKVLTYDEYGAINIGWVDKNFWTNKKIWTTGHMQLEDVTHWQPLPEPPKGE